MGVYVGFIEKIPSDRNVFYNYRPVGEIRGSQVFQLSLEEQAQLLPESKNKNINLQYPWDNVQMMEESFTEHSLVVFEFTTADLEPNYKANGERNQTGYKVSVADVMGNGKLRPIDMDNIYYTIRKTALHSDFKNDAIVEIDCPVAVPGDRVFVELDDFWAGPYEVGFRDYTSTYYIKPQIKENKHTLSGYKKSQVYLQELSSYDGYWGSQDHRWTVLVPKKSAEYEQIDVISDALLVEGFKDSLENGKTSGGKVALDDIPTLLKRYEDSILSGTILSDEVRKDRLNRLVAILTAEEDVDDTLGTVSDFICDLLVKYKDSPNVEEWLQATLERHPELLERLKDTQTIATRTAQLEQSLEELREERAALEREIADKQTQVEKVDRTAVEEKTKELLHMDAEYAALCEKLEAAKSTLGVVESISDLKKTQVEVQAEVSYLESHKARLERESSGMELQFHQLISRQHEKMVEISFDGFMASKMLRAAAEWEAETVAQQHETLAKDINSIEATGKTPEELVDYLCRTIQTVRPTYSRNTIVNIAICITQGFLTVFSGEPGCGKTSICNIFGEVLGLNKIPQYMACPEGMEDQVKRYVPVSVERGWTSKRDFVGYYNPLSKTFDKSNRRVYDALHQLDIEKREGIRKLPYLILLDEANLSPVEYYWSDFMNICDDIGPQSTVNLGEDYIFGIPDTLHFLATINNDHTTETLSPRLIDRAWIVSLPQQYSATLSEEVIPAEKVEVIPWESLCAAFIPKREECVFSAKTQKTYDTILAKLREKRFAVSPRIDRAIKRYWVIGSKRFAPLDETKTDAETVALDYAIAQRILPKIVGNGEAFEKWLDELRGFCSSEGLNMSAKLLRDIIDRGNQQMKYYQFFC